MAERRMFAKTIIDSDCFLDMPLSAQCLYFHLSMRADDDGFINNPKRIQRTIGCNDKDFQSLIDNDFIIPFDSGIIVIKHWKVHNYIRNDRYKKTVYAAEKDMLSQDENNAYTLKNSCPSTFGIPSDIPKVDKLETQVRLGKDSIGKNNIYAQNKEQFCTFWNAYPKKKSKQAAEKAFRKIAPDEALFRNMLNAIEEQKKSAEWQKDNGQYIPHPATWLNGRRWEDETNVKVYQQEAEKEFTIGEYF